MSVALGRWWQESAPAFPVPVLAGEKELALALAGQNLLVGSPTGFLATASPVRTGRNPGMKLRDACNGNGGSPHGISKHTNNQSWNFWLSIGSAWAEQRCTHVALLSRLPRGSCGFVLRVTLASMLSWSFPFPLLQHK